MSQVTVGQGDALGPAHRLCQALGADEVEEPQQLVLKSLLDLPDALLLLVFRFLKRKDRLALSHTCTQLKRVAENGGAFADLHHHIDSPQSIVVAIAYRARDISIGEDNEDSDFLNKYIISLFVQSYTMLVPSPRWAIRSLTLNELPWGEGHILGTDVKLGLTFPTLEQLKLITWGGRFDFPALFAGLNMLTRLNLELPDCVSIPAPPRLVSPSVFAALPNLRSLTWEAPEMISDGNDAEPDVCENGIFQPLCVVARASVAFILRASGKAFICACERPRYCLLCSHFSLFDAFCFGGALRVMTQHQC